MDKPTLNVYNVLTFRMSKQEKSFFHQPYHYK